MPDPKRNPDSGGNTYIPNSYQKPNAFVDVLMPLLPCTVNVLLDVACRRILGWEEHRATRRDRISRSQFTEATSFSYNTIDSGLDILKRANILVPVGGRNVNGQEYELNLGQLGQYDFDYLRQLPRRTGNPNPAEARSTRLAKQVHPESVPPHIGGQGYQNLTVSNFDSVNQIEPDSISDRKGLYLIEGTKLKTEKGDIEVIDNEESSLETRIGTCNFTVLQIWQAALGELQLQVSKSTFDTWLRDTRLHAYREGRLVIAVQNQYAYDWLTARLLSTICRTVRGITQEPNLNVEFVVSESAG